MRHHAEKCINLPEHPELWTQLRGLLWECVRNALMLISDTEGDADARLSSLHNKQHEIHAFTALKELFIAEPLLQRAFLGSKDWCKTPGEESYASAMEIWSFVEHGIRLQLDKPERQTFTSKAFDEFWKAFEEYGRTDTQQWGFVAPLINFVADPTVEIIQLSERIRIRQLSANEKIKFKINEEPWGVAKQYCVEALTTAPKEFSLSPASAEKPVNSVVSALRIIGNPKVWVNRIWAVSDSPFSGSPMGWRPFRWEGDRGIPLFAHTEEEGLYVLHRQQSDELRSLWNKLWRILNQTARLNLILHRHALAFERFRASPEDALVDAWVALEGMFLPGIDRAIRATASARISSFLGTDETGRKEIRDFISESYRVRSKIVHGEPMDEQKVFSTASTTFDYLQLSLRKLILHYDSFPYK
jgi:Apea-like HEPN